LRNASSYALGNLTNDTNHTYTYDAENNIVKVDSGSTATYTYNALNQRVRSVVGSATTEFVFNSSGQRVFIWDAVHSVQLQGQYYWSGKPVAYYKGGALHFQHQDWEGTERLRTTYTGTVEGSFQSLPFGDGQTTVGTDGDAYHYGMLDHDSESDTDHAQFRQYSNEEGRWHSPDPYAGSYDLSNPQSLNRYAYALNNPLADVDRLGLDQCDDDDSDSGIIDSGCAGQTGGDDGCDSDSSCFAPGGGAPTFTIWGAAFEGITIPCTPAFQCQVLLQTPQIQVSGPSTGFGGGGGASNDGIEQCGGSARVLQGNAATIGSPGGFSGSSVGNFPVTANGAAIIPSQWGMGKAALRPFINQISGVFPNVNASFQGLVDIVGGTPPPGFTIVQTGLMTLNPGKLIVELPGASQDYGVTAVTLTVPSGVGCPAGTVQVPQ
jgi:RHS repeat-associated protein